MKPRVLKFYKTLAEPVMLYSSRTWVISQRDESCVWAAEMKFLRATVLLDKYKMSLSIVSLLVTMKTNKPRWCARMSQMLSEHFPVRAKEHDLPGSEKGNKLFSISLKWRRGR